MERATSRHVLGFGAWGMGAWSSVLRCGMKIWLIFREARDTEILQKQYILKLKNFRTFEAGRSGSGKLIDDR